MTIAELEKALSKMGFNDVVRSTSNRLIVYLPASDRVSSLKIIADEFNGKYTSANSGSGWKSSVGAALLPNNFVIIAKPSAKGSSASFSSLDARVFSTMGKNNIFEFNGKNVKVVTFTDYKTIEMSIIRGCKTNNLLGDHYAEIFTDFFANNKLQWSSKVPIQAISKLGVYVGELLIGWAFLKQKQSNFFITNPFKGTPIAFHIPTDPAFSGVDSFVEMKGDSYYAISSKYGAGAKASFFTNLFEKGIDKSNSLQSSFFKEMCNFAKSKNIDYKKSKEFIYNFGIYHLLKIKSSDIKSPENVFSEIRLGKADSKEVKTLIEAIQKTKPEKQILDALPQSASAYFNRKIADGLNDDTKSVEQMKEILAGKDYWQANIDTVAWNKGVLKFKFISSREAKLKLYGNKSSIKDVTSKQGWINYELGY